MNILILFLFFKQTAQPATVPLGPTTLGRPCSYAAYICEGYGHPNGNYAVFNRDRRGGGHK